MAPKPGDFDRRTAEAAAIPIDTDQHKEVLVNAFDLVNYAKEIADENEGLFETLLDMVKDYQKVSFDKLKDSA